MSVEGKKELRVFFFLSKRTFLSKRLGFQANSPTNWSQRVHLPHENWKFGGEMKTINCDLYLYQTECYMDVDIYAHSDQNNTSEIFK